MTIKDLSRLKPGTAFLWNGNAWTRLLGVSKTKRKSNELELVLRSGERISCTPTHKFPTKRGLLVAGDIKAGDILEKAILPRPDSPRRPEHIGYGAAWLAGLYIAEGSRSGDTIQISGHVKEERRWEHIKRIAESYGGSATRTISGNCMNIRVYGEIIRSVLNHLVSGRTAKDKCLSPVCWRYGNPFLMSILIGYLEGDGHWDPKNKRWRIGFTRNYNLERDLRTICARLDWRLVLNLSRTKYKGKYTPTFRGEIRRIRSGHHNEKNTAEVIAIRKARCREVYDIGVEDEPHVFALASGILTHNSKPNPMPESVTDRPTKSHEFIFLMSKSARYYYNAEAISEKGEIREYSQDKIKRKRNVGGRIDGYTSTEGGYGLGHYGIRNRRTIWSIPTQPYSGAHFATFPEEIPRLCILAGSRPGDYILDPFGGSGTTAKVALENGRNPIHMDIHYFNLARKRMSVTPAMAGLMG